MMKHKEQILQNKIQLILIKKKLTSTLNEYHKENRKHKVIKHEIHKKLIHKSKKLKQIKKNILNLQINIILYNYNNNSSNNI